MKGRRIETGFQTPDDLTINEKAILADQENIQTWVEGLNAQHLHEALIERLAECEGVRMEESEMSALLREICSRLLLLEEIEQKLSEIKSLGEAERITPVKTPA